MYQFIPTRIIPPSTCEHRAQVWGLFACLSIMCASVVMQNTSLFRVFGLVLVRASQFGLSFNLFYFIHSIMECVRPRTESQKKNLMQKVEPILGSGARFAFICWPFCRYRANLLPYNDLSFNLIYFNLLFLLQFSIYALYKQYQYNIC